MINIWYRVCFIYCFINLLIAKAKKIITQGIDDNESFGDGTEKAVNQYLKKKGYRENGIAGKNFIDSLYKDIK